MISNSLQPAHYSCVDSTVEADVSAFPDVAIAEVAEYCMLTCELIISPPTAPPTRNLKDSFLAAWADMTVIFQTRPTANKASLQTEAKLFLRYFMLEKAGDANRQQTRRAYRKLADSGYYS